MNPELGFALTILALVLLLPFIVIGTAWLVTLWVRYSKWLIDRLAPPK